MAKLIPSEERIQRVRRLYHQPFLFDDFAKAVQFHIAAHDLTEQHFTLIRNERNKIRACQGIVVSF